MFARTCERYVILKTPKSRWLNPHFADETIDSDSLGKLAKGCIRARAHTQSFFLLCPLPVMVMNPLKNYVKILGKIHFLLPDFWRIGSKKPLLYPFKIWVLLKGLLNFATENPFLFECYL